MGQKLKNAPVYFTIAQVRFNPVLSLKTYMPEIQEHMRKAGYPDFKQSFTVAFNLALITGGELQQGTTPPPPFPLPEERYVFSNMENTRGFILQQNALSFQTTDYDDYQNLSSVFLNGLETVHNAVGLNFSERIGIRYLDAVYPREGEDLSQYLVEQVLGINKLLEGAEIVHSFSETVVKFKNGGKVVSRTILQNKKLGFPPDLQPDRLRLKDRFKDIEGVHAVIDTDGAFEGREPFDIGKVKNRLEDLHKVISDSFRATTTVYARSVWA